jgi:hypothetical protein
MNLERILAENLLRFGGKNLNKQLMVYKYLLEQDSSQKQAEAIELLKTQGEAYQAFQSWQSEVNKTYGNIILTKTQEYVPINQEPIKLEDVFYNNFVTLETGVKDPAALKANLDTMIETLKQQGANMTDPKTVIEIVSTATSPAASTGPNKDDFGGTVPATHKKIDHTYGGNLAYDKVGKPTPESIKWAQTNGNEYLAKARGESVKKYLESKGVKATIIVIALTGQPKRKFLITAKQEGTRKVITPIGVPDIEWSCGFSAQFKVAYDVDFSEMIRTNKSLIDALDASVREKAQGAYTGTGFAMAEPDPAKFPDKKSKEYAVEYYFLNGNVKRGSNLPYLAVYGLPQGELYITYTGGWSLGNSAGSLPNLQDKMISPFGRALDKIDTAIANAKSTDPVTVTKGTYSLSDLDANYQGGKKGVFTTNIPNSGVDTGNQSSGDIVSQGAKGVSGIDEASRLNTTGYTNNGTLIYAQLRNAASPLFAQLTGTDVAAELSKIKDAALTISKEHGQYYFGQDSNAKAKYDAILAMKINASGKGDLKALIKAAVAAGLPGVSETISTDPAYWKRAYFMDFTKKNQYGLPTRGQLLGQAAVEFFKDTEFAK